jgi:Tfp pilus assembly protein PilF
MTKDIKAASIKKELITLTTYPYSDPSPIPEFGRLYPYNRFDGYTNTGTAQDWEMIVMENDYIKLWINPAVGGKIWGAVEKATGKEFIYFNHTAKFRDVAMRGPWTSGGMENNMGIIGHTPSCSSPVDHAMRTNADGSVSCFIGATDWPSRTQWTVEINLPANSAAFSTKTNWYNNSCLEQSYYQWNNVAVKTAGNLEYINPGHQRIHHDGKVQNWPKDEQGRTISFYDKNNFGEYKSYHILGSISDFWGCYWHNDNFGFGHSAAYDDKPGKKIWIWGLSRYGMIWENLLTDADGQYTEVQSGRLFNQSISSATKTPFKHYSFAPYTFDRWDEYWFPVKNLGGFTYGNPQLSFYLSEHEGVHQLNICANQPLQHTLKIGQNSNIILTWDITLCTMQIITIALPEAITANELQLWLNDDLLYNGVENCKPLSRPAQIAEGYSVESVEAIYTQAKEWERQRFYQHAVDEYHNCLKKDPFYIAALCGLAGLYIRQSQYPEALTLLLKALSVNTYHAESNYLYGLANARLNNVIDAKDGFSIASLSPAYRAAAYTELAKLFIKENQFNKALGYLKKALPYHTRNQQALRLQLIVTRLQGNTSLAKQLADELIQSNPIDHLVRFELYQLALLNAKDFKAGISSELPYETFLELASFYFNLKLYAQCLDILALSPAYAMVSIWTAYIYTLQNNSKMANALLEQAAKQSPELVFPHREEDVNVLKWAIDQSPSWKFKYYLALGYIQMLRTDEAIQLLQDCRTEPDFYVFYIVRANLQHDKDIHASEIDLYAAFQNAPDEWRTTLLLSKHLADNNRWDEALDLVENGYLQHTDNYYLGLQMAKCYMHTARLKQGIALMNRLNVLPNEGASEGRNIWKETHLFAALKAIEEQDYPTAIYYINESKRWPENMGVGKPYEVDERLENFLALYCLQQSHQSPPKPLIDNIACYRDHFADTLYSTNDFLTIYVLLQHDEFTKARQILNTWLQNNPDDLAARWTQAFMNGDTEKLHEIALIKPVKREALPYEILFEDRSFPFVKDMHSRGFFNLIPKTVS